MASWGTGAVFADWTPEPVQFDRTPIHYVWQGPDESVYAGGGRTEQHLLRWNGSGWDSLAALPGRIYFGFTSSDGTVWFLTRRVLSVQSRSAGNIQGLWRWSPGTDSPEPVEGFDPESFSITVSSVHFHAAEDTQGRIFLTTASPVIYIIEEGRFREWHTVEIKETHPGHPGRPPNWGYLYPSRLADGRVVMVGYGPSNYNVFSGYLVIDDLQVQKHARRGFNPLGYVKSLQPDPRGVIYQHSGGRIYLLDVDAHQFKQLDAVLSLTEHGSFAFWQQDGENAWALFSRTHTPENEPSKQQIRLWRRISDGAWKAFSPWIDTGQGIWHPGYATTKMQKIPLILSDNAVWIGTHDFGVIRVDRELGDVRTLNWRHGLPLNDATWLFPLPDGQVWAGGVGGFQGSGSFDPETIQKRGQPDNRILSFSPLSGGFKWPSTQTSDGTVYELRPIDAGVGHRPALRKWTGQSWESLTLWELMGHPRAHRLLTDRQDRIWVVETHREQTASRRAVVIEGATMKRVRVGEFENLLAAYPQFEEDAGFQPGFDFSHNTFFPYISPKRHVLYLDRDNLLAYNGESWEPLRPGNISEDYQDLSITKFGYTEDTGDAAVRIRNTNYKLTDSGKWMATDAAFVQVEGERTLRKLKSGRHRHQRVIETFDFSPKARVWDLGDDNHWIHTEEGQAYFTYGPWTSPVIPEGGASPLSVVENFGAYYTANTGQRMLRVGQGWLVFPAPDPGVPPEVTATRLSPDRMLFEVSRADDVKVWRWRFNESEWSETARHDTLEVSRLLPGHYQVHLQPLSPGLTWMDVKTVEFEIDYDLQLVLSDALNDLMSDDWERRNLAVRHLAIAPEAAITILQSVETEALSPEDRWWVEAALQSMQRTQPIINQIHTYSTEP